ncbi:mucin-22-like [Watersipora subatra]|uniref:mucin-22-like n=1 Tax=Watersipora subatra TaxID=2589382 RepID=UPI00355B8BBF
MSRIVEAVRKLREWSITIDPDDPEATSKASNTEDKRDTSHICKQNDVTDLTANDSNGQRGQVVPTMTAHGATSAQHVTSTLRPATGVHGSITSVQQVALTLTQASGDHEPTTSVPRMTSALTHAAGDHEPTTSVPQITSALTHAAGDHEETKNAHQVATRVTRSAGTHKPIESVKQLTLTPVVDAPTNIRQMASALTQEAGDCKITTPVQDTISSTQAVSAKEPFISGHQITSKLTQGACARDLEQVSTTLAQVAGTHEAIATAYQVTPTFAQTIIKNQMVKSNSKQVLAGESPSGRNMVTGATVTYQNGCDKKHFRDRLKHQDRLKHCLLRENDIIYLFSPNAKDLAIIPEGDLICLLAEVHHLDTRLLVAGLPYFSITEIHSIQSSGAHRHTPFLCRTSCDILPAFQCKQLSVGCCYKDLKRKDPDDMVICLSLSDTDDRSVVIPATVNQANLKSLSCGDDTRAGENNNGCQLLARIVPTIEIKDTQLSVRYVNRVDLILQIFGDVVNVCYSKTV